MGKSADKIGIYAPYGWEEATYMAGSLMEWATRHLGYRVSYMAPAAFEPGVHYLWDEQVLDGAKHSFKVWASNCAQIIWFSLSPTKLETAINLGCKNTLVALPHRLSAGDLPLLGRFDRIVCPTRPVFEALSTQRIAKNVHHLPWDCGQPILDKEGKRSSVTRILATIDTPTAKVQGALLCYLLRVLLDGNPNVQLTLIYSKNWPRHAIIALHELEDLHEGRVTAVRKPTHCQRLELLRESDWVFCPSTRDNSCFHALEALSAGCPVIAYNASPYNELLQSMHNACLASCNLSKGFMDTPVIQPNTRELLDTLCEVTASRSVLNMLRGNIWAELETRRRDFQGYWTKQWSKLEKS